MRSGVTLTLLLPDSPENIAFTAFVAALSAQALVKQTRLRGPFQAAQKSYDCSVNIHPSTCRDDRSTGPDFSPGVTGSVRLRTHPQCLFGFY
jgi:hypothetical protein